MECFSKTSQPIAMSQTQSGLLGVVCLCLTGQTAWAERKEREAVSHTRTTDAAQTKKAKRKQIVLHFSVTWIAECMHAAQCEGNCYVCWRFRVHSQSAPVKKYPQVERDVKGFEILESWPLAKGWSSCKKPGGDLTKTVQFLQGGWGSDGRVRGIGRTSSGQFSAHWALTDQARMKTPFLLWFLWSSEASNTALLTALL